MCTTAKSALISTSAITSGILRRSSWIFGNGDQRCCDGAGILGANAACIVTCLGSSCAMCARRPWRKGELLSIAWPSHCLHKHRKYSSCVEAELLMPKHTEGGPDFATVRRDRDPSILVSAEHLIQPLARSHILSIGRLGSHSIPELVFFFEATLDLPRREQVVDVILASAVVTSV